MTGYEFIFSNKLKRWLARHLVFWGVYCIINFYIGIDLSNGGLKDLQTSTVYQVSLMRLICFLPITVLEVYFFIYILLPKFIPQKKYVAFSIAFVAMMIFCFGANIFFGYVFLHFVGSKAGNDGYVILTPFQTSYHTAIHYGIGLTGVAVGIKLAKEMYLQQIENNRLAKQDEENKIKLLKSHINPDFLFHSLGILHKKIKTSYNDAAQMVLHLSETLSYILYDCADEKIALKRELSILQHLAAIEKMNTANKTEVTITVNGTSHDKYILPLLVFSVFQHLLFEKNNYANVKAKIDALIDIKDRELHICMSFKDYNGHNILKRVINKVIDNLQKSLPKNYLHCETKKNGDQVIKVILFESDADTDDILNQLATKKYEGA